jgi:hypothetical protein
MEAAKHAVAAKMDNPASAQFMEMNRALRPNIIGAPIDTICGLVKGKTAFGDDTGAMPFLYLVQESKAYLVDGKVPDTASSAYHKVCG